MMKPASWSPSPHSCAPGAATLSGGVGSSSKKAVSPWSCLRFCVCICVALLCVCVRACVQVCGSFIAFIRLFNQRLLRLYYMPGTALKAGHTVGFLEISALRRLGRKCFKQSEETGMQQVPS